MCVGKKFSKMLSVGFVFLFCLSVNCKVVHEVTNR